MQAAYCLKIDILFGWHLDGPSYPDSPEPGKLVLGPVGLLEQLAVRLGLSCPFPHKALRIAQYVSFLRSIDDGQRFFSPSFLSDAWGTATALLRLRDELVAAGWHHNTSLRSSERLTTLTALESQSQSEVESTCASDLMRAIITALTQAPSIPIRQIELMDKRSMLPPIWRRLFLCLEAVNISIVERAHQLPLYDSDQGQLLKYISRADHRALKGDGSFSIVESDDEIQAAEFLAALLSKQSTSGAETVIIRGGSTSFLDQTLRKQNLPRLGGGFISAQRSVLQMLPLFFANCWKPFDPYRLIEFLMLPQSPVPPYVASCFIEALRNQPGIDGPAWQQAWTKALERKRLALTKEGKSDNEIDGFEITARQEWAQWLQPELFDPSVGISAITAVNVCHRIRNRALSLFAQCGDEIYSRAAVNAENTALAIEIHKAADVTRRQLEHILSSVLADGYRADPAQEAMWSLVDHPGQICAPVENIFWWHFIAPDDAVPRPHLWSHDELTELGSHDIQLDSAIAATAREAISWRRPMLAPCRKLCLIRPRTVAGRYVAAHPFHHELQGLLETAEPAVGNRLIVQAHQLYKNDKFEFGDQVLLRRLTKAQTLPGERGVWHVSGTAIADKVESPASLERLLACPLSWLLRSRAFLRRGNLLTIASGEQLAGNLAHAVFAQVFSAPDFGTADDIALRAQEVFDSLCPRYAAPLLLPGKSLQRSNLRKAVTEGAAHLASLIREAGFSTVRCENELTMLHDGIALSGRYDIHLTHPEHADFVLDLKWSKFPHDRKQELEQGHALQLAIYSSLCRSSSGRRTEAGYYVLAQKELFTSADKPFEPYRHVEGPPLTDTFNNIISAYKSHMEHLRAGTIYATGIAAPSMENCGAVSSKSDSTLGSKPIWWTPVPKVKLSKEPPCKVCDYNNICGKRRLNSS